MFSSGTTAIATNGDAAVALFSLPPGGAYGRLVLRNEGAAPGFYSVDGGSTWARISGTPAGSVVIPEVWRGRSNSAPQVKRVASGSDLGNIYASADTI